MACQKLIFRRLLLLLAKELVVKVELERWRQEKEKEIRRDAIKGSITTLLKKVGEHIAPLYMLRELGIDPRDLRLIGTLIL